MQIIKAIIIGIIQGLTEFIPVSSSGHLILADKFLDLKSAGLAFDLALHLGTLIALLLIFGKDYLGLLSDVIKRNKNSRLAWYLLIATVPAVIAGVMLEHKVETSFRSTNLVAWDLIIVAFLMLVAERLSKPRTNLENINAKQSIGIGFAQVFALFPGVSRSGSTMIAGLMGGLDRLSAIRFSFLLSGPVIAGAVLQVFLQDSSLSQIKGHIDIFLAGGLAALISGYLAIKFLLNYLAKHPINIFAYYRIVVGLVILLARL